MVCELTVAPGHAPTTSPQLAERLCLRFPNLPAHTCINPEGDSFASVMAHTSLPHLLEHLVIELQAQTSGDSSTTFVGTSEWTDEKTGRARIEVNFADDLSALRAFRDAVEILNAALLE